MEHMDVIHNSINQLPGQMAQQVANLKHKQYLANKSVPSITLIPQIQ